MSGTPFLRLYTYVAKVARIIDADTFDLLIDVGFSAGLEHRVRLLSSTGGVNAPEKNATDPAVRLAAQAAQARVVALLPLGGMVWVQTKQDRVDGFRRYLAQVWLMDGRNVGDMLLAEGHAVPWVRR